MHRKTQREREIHFSVCKGLDTKIEFHTENLSAASTSLLAPVWFLRKLPCFFQTPTPTSNISVFSQLFHVHKLLCTIARIEGVKQASKKNPTPRKLQFFLCRDKQV